MTIFLQDLKQYFVTNHLVTSTNCFVEICPPTPASSVTLYKYDANGQTDEKSIQVMSKADSPDSAISALETIYNFLFDSEKKCPTLTINGFPCIFNLLTEPLFLKQEDSSFYYIFNMEITVDKL